MSKTVAALIARLANMMTRPMSPNRRRIALALAGERLQQTVRVATRRGELVFACPTARALMEPFGFASEEPETIRWLDEHVRPGETLWDIGANVGSYSLYAALGREVSVLAFEPSAATFAALVRNIELNRVGGRVTPLCLALSDRTAIDVLNMAETGAGHSMHAFGQLETVDHVISPVFSQPVPGFSVDDFRRVFALPAPDHVKLDVDSIEAKILRGAAGTLPSVRTVMMEVIGAAGVAASAVLEGAGFTLAPQETPARRNRLFVNERATARRGGRAAGGAAAP
jgi:FkbM family methyltransferase